MKPITENKYWREIHDLAKQVVYETRERCEGNHESARETLYAVTHETIEGHSWVIYTYMARQVLVHSRNDGYAVEEWGADGIVEDGVLNWSLLAYGALLADVQEAISGLPEPFDYHADDLGLWPDDEADDE